MTNSVFNNASRQQRNVEIASRSKNPMEAVPGVFHYKAIGDGCESFSLYCRQKNDMDSTTLKWAFKLSERNVAHFYKELSIGWQPKVKHNDLNKSWARYLVALDSKKARVAYAMFRFDMDYGSSVLYCYEVQIEPSARRVGLGKHMMLALEQCAKYWKMEKIILTVLKNNPIGMAFFKSVGYTVDESSPDMLEKADYDILSKRFNI